MRGAGSYNKTSVKRRAGSDGRHACIAAADWQLIVCRINN